MKYQRSFLFNFWQVLHLNSADMWMDVIQVTELSLSVSNFDSKGVGGGFYNHQVGFCSWTQSVKGGGRILQLNSVCPVTCIKPFTSLWSVKQQKGGADFIITRWGALLGRFHFWLSSGADLQNNMWAIRWGRGAKFGKKCGGGVLTAENTPYSCRKSNTFYFIS